MPGTEREGRIAAITKEALSVFAVSEGEALSILEGMRELDLPAQPAALRGDARAIYAAASAFFKSDHNGLLAFIRLPLRSGQALIRALSSLMLGEMASEDPKKAFPALREIAKSAAGSEYAYVPAALRAPLESSQTSAMVALAEWTKDESESVRRAAVEALRPYGDKLPPVQWLVKSPNLVVGMLTPLITDRSLAVRKSISLVMEEMARDHPDIALGALMRWLEDGDEYTKYIIKNSCRPLMKSRPAKAAALLRRAA